MYSDIILSRLNNLTYLKPLKGSNVTATSKKNTFNDIVKFYAKIDENEVIQNITFKATGCTYFLVFCDYFCSIAEGKTIKEALKIDEKKLFTLMELTDSKKHVISVILSSFQLLIKKYRKGLGKGTITPITAEKGHSKETKKDTKSSPSQTTSEKENAKSKAKTTNKENNIPSKKQEQVEKKVVKTESKKEAKEKSQDKNEAKDENVKQLSSMINKINSKKLDNKNANVSMDKNVNNVDELKENIHSQSDEKVKNEKEKEKPQKKGLFSWLRKNK